MRGVWLWLRDQGLKFPLQPGAYIRGSQIIWTEPTYHAVTTRSTHPADAGAYTSGRSRTERLVRADGAPGPPPRAAARRMGGPDQRSPRGYIDWDTYQANQARIGANIRPRAHQPGTGAVREGCAMLQGLATCGTCGRKLAVYYEGKRKTTPGYYCTGTGNWSTAAAPATCASAARPPTPRSPPRSWPRSSQWPCKPAWKAAEQIEHGHDAATAQHRKVEQARYQAARAERRYQAVDPENRLVARGLEAAWERALPSWPPPKPNSPAARQPAPPR